MRNLVFLFLMLFHVVTYCVGQEINHSTLEMSPSDINHYSKLKRNAEAKINNGRTRDYHNLFISNYYLGSEINILHSILDSLLKYHPVYFCEFLFKERAPFPIFNTLLIMNNRGRNVSNYMEPKCKCVFENMDSLLINIIKIIGANDQKFRANSNILPKSLSDIRDSIDVINFNLINAIIEKYGYPGVGIVGAKYSHVAWTVLQHNSNLEKFLPIIKEACDSEQLFPLAYPYSVDRVQFIKNLPQLFGTQEIYNEKTKTYELYKIDNIIDVNERRKFYGCGTIEEKLTSTGLKLQSVEK